MPPHQGNAEQRRRQALADKRLRGHRIKHGLEELGDLDAAPPQPPPVERERPGETCRSPVSRSADRPAEGATTLYKSVFGDGWVSWRRVKQLLFSPKASPTEKLWCLQELRLWHARARGHRALPSYVEATELLMRCVLQDEQAGQRLCRPGHGGDGDPGGEEAAAGSVAGQSEALAAAYGAALSRAVHVMTGSFATASAVTYRRRAKNIGFPEEAVEVRQRVAHGATLPSLSELRWTCGLVLQFLFQKYWVEQERQLKLMEEEDDGVNNNNSSSRKNRGQREGGGGKRKGAKREREGSPSAPQTSIEEMKQLLAQLGPDSEEEEEEESGTGTEGKANAVAATATATLASPQRTFAGGWSIS